MLLHLLILLLQQLNAHLYEKPVAKFPALLLHHYYFVREYCIHFLNWLIFVLKILFFLLIFSIGIIN